MLDSRYEATIENPTASDKGTNIARGAPCMKNEEMNTARMQTIAKQPRDGGLRISQPHGPGNRGGAAHLGVDVLDFHGRLVHQNANGQRQPAQGHHVDRLPAQPERDHGRHQRQRDVQQDDDRAPPVPQEQRGSSGRPARPPAPLRPRRPKWPASRRATGRTRN